MRQGDAFFKRLIQLGLGARVIPGCPGKSVGRLAPGVPGSGNGVARRFDLGLGGTENRQAHAHLREALMLALGALQRGLGLGQRGRGALIGSLRRLHGLDRQSQGLLLGANRAVALRQGSGQVAGPEGSCVDQQSLDRVNQPRPAVVGVPPVPVVQRQSVDPVERERRLGQSDDDVDQLFPAKRQAGLVTDVRTVAGRRRPEDHHTREFGDLVFQFGLPVDAGHVFVPPDVDAQPAQAARELDRSLAISA